MTAIIEAMKAANQHFIKDGNGCDGYAYCDVPTADFSAAERLAERLRDAGVTSAVATYRGSGDMSVPAVRISGVDDFENPVVLAIGLDEPRVRGVKPRGPSYAAAVAESDIDPKHGTGRCD